MVNVNEDNQTATNRDDTDSIDDTVRTVRERLGVPFTRTPTMQDEESFLETLKSEERSAFIARSTVISSAAFHYFLGGMHFLAIFLSLGDS